MKMSRTIYEITADMELLMSMLDDEDMDIDVVHDTLEGLAGELESKAAGCCMVLKEYEARSDAFKKEIDRLQTMKSAADKNAKRLKDALFTAMIATNTSKLDAGLFKLSVRNNAESIDQIPDDIPEKYLVPQLPTVDKRLLLSDVKAGIDVPGVTTKRSQSLTIK